MLSSCKAVCLLYLTSGVGTHRSDGRFEAPIEDKRQIGDLQCNIARFKIVTDIAKMKGTVKTLAGQVAA